MVKDYYLINVTLSYSGEFTLELLSKYKNKN